MWISPRTDFNSFEADELFWFIERKEHTETRENTYVMILMSREPRQIVAFAVEKSRTAEEIQKIIDSAPPARYYYTDGNYSYTDVAFPGIHKRNAYDKSDTHNVESVNADLRTYIAGLMRRSRCFFRKLETIRAVLRIFVNAYNKFGEYKHRYRVPVVHKPSSSGKLHKWRDLPLGVMDFI